MLNLSFSKLGQILIVRKMTSNCLCHGYKNVSSDIEESRMSKNLMSQNLKIGVVLI